MAGWHALAICDSGTPTGNMTEFGWPSCGTNVTLADLREVRPGEYLDEVPSPNPKARGQNGDFF